MKKLLALSLMFCVSGVMIGCATTTTTVVSNKDGTYTVAASDTTEDGALKGAIKKADIMCHSDDKTTMIITHFTKYTGGMDANSKGALNAAASASAIAGTYIPQQDANKDYMVTVNFSCN